MARAFSFREKSYEPHAAKDAVFIKCAKCGFDKFYKGKIFQNYYCMKCSAKLSKTRIVDLPIMFAVPSGRIKKK